MGDIINISSIHDYNDFWGLKRLTHWLRLSISGS